MKSGTRERLHRVKSRKRSWKLTLPGTDAAQDRGRRGTGPARDRAGAVSPALLPGAVGARTSATARLPDFRAHVSEVDGSGNKGGDGKDRDQ